MKPEIGQIVRRVGLLMEMICLLGLVSLSPEKQAQLTFAGIGPQQVLTWGLVTGFVLWFTGTAAIYWKRKPRGPE